MLDIFKRIFLIIFVLIILTVIFALVDTANAKDKEPFNAHDYYFNKVKDLNYDERASWYQGYLDDKKWSDELRNKHEEGK